jgi:Glycine rich protein
MNEQVATMGYSRSIFSVTILLCLSVASGCARVSPSVNPIPFARADAAARSRTFAYTGKSQAFTVPVGVTQVTILADGAAGGGSVRDPQVGGRGGRVYAVVPVQPNETLYVRVGGTTDGTKGGYNGGGDGEFIQSYNAGSGGGGGASDVREGGKLLSNRIVVAAGGGGSGFHGYSNDGGAGGPGGTRTGGKGVKGQYGEAGSGGNGGAPNHGGKGGKRGDGCDYQHCNLHGQPGRRGTFGFGGDGGGNSCGSCFPGGGGGGGGGGWYGGGGGGSGVSSSTDTGAGGGGGGGSSYVESKAIGVRMYRGWKDDIGNGTVTLRWRQ